MATNSYFPNTEADRAVWLANYQQKLPVHGPVCGLGAEEMRETQNDIAYYLWLLQTWNPALQNDAREATAYKTLMGTGGGAGPVEPPAPSSFPGHPPARTPGILTRLFNQVARIKANPGYTDPIGRDLGIVATPDTTEHPVPEFTATVEQGGAGQRVRLGFTKYGHDGVWIESRRGEGDWEFLAIDTVKPYLDERPLLAPNTPEHREYRLRWWDQGEAHGEFSPVQRVTVGV